MCKVSEVLWPWGHMTCNNLGREPLSSKCRPNIKTGSRGWFSYCKTPHGAVGLPL